MSPKKPAQEGATSASTGLTTKEISRFVTFYRQNIRAQSDAECTGVYRQIQRLLANGVEAEDIALALENYAADPWRKQQDPRFSKPIRSFFTAENIREWLTPKPSLKPLDPLGWVQHFKPDFVPPPAVLSEPDESVEDEL